MAPKAVVVAGIGVGVATALALVVSFLPDPGGDLDLPPEVAPAAADAPVDREARRRRDALERAAPMTPNEAAELWTPKFHEPEDGGIPDAPVFGEDPLPAGVMGVRAIFEHHDEALKRCLREFAPRDHTQKDHVVMDLSIGPTADGQGQISAMAVAHEKEPHDWVAFEQCVATELGEPRFLPPQRELTVQYPIWYRK